MQAGCVVADPGGPTAEWALHSPALGWLHYCPLPRTKLCNFFFLLNGSQGKLLQFLTTLTFEANLMVAWFGWQSWDWPRHSLPRKGSHDEFLGEMLSRTNWGRGRGMLLDLALLSISSVWFYSSAAVVTLILLLHYCMTTWANLLVKCLQKIPFYPCQEYILLLSNYSPAVEGQRPSPSGFTYGTLSRKNTYAGKP